MIERLKGEKLKHTLVGVAIFLLVAGIMFLFSAIGDKPKRQVAEDPPIRVNSPEKLEEESFKAVYGETLSRLEKRMDDLERSQPQPEKQPRGGYGDNRGLFAPPLPPDKALQERERQTQAPMNDPAPPSGAGYPPMPQVNREPVKEVLTGLIHIGSPVVDDTDKAKKSIPQKPPVTIPAGSFVRATLLSGLVVPTAGRATDRPVPAILRITDEAVLPNMFRADIRDCFVTTAATGDLAAELAHLKLETLSCIRDDGTAIQKRVTGYVAGENGIEGLSGRVVTKQGAMLGRTIMGGFLDGAAQAFQTSQTSVAVSSTGTVQTVDPENAGQVALFSGAGEATKRLADFYMDLVNQMVPVIEINAGRDVDIVLLAGVEFEQEDDR